MGGRAETRLWPYLASTQAACLDRSGRRFARSLDRMKDCPLEQTVLHSLEPILVSRLRGPRLVPGGRPFVEVGHPGCRSSFGLTRSTLAVVAPLEHEAAEPVDDAGDEHEHKPGDPSEERRQEPLLRFGEGRLAARSRPARTLSPSQMPSRRWSRRSPRRCLRLGPSSRPQVKCQSESSSA